PYDPAPHFWSGDYVSSATGDVGSIEGSRLSALLGEGRASAKCHSQAQSERGAVSRDHRVSRFGHSADRERAFVEARSAVSGIARPGEDADSADASGPSRRVDSGARG